MNENNLIEDIITTKNTLTILQQVFIINKNSLQAFTSIFDSITSLIHILTHASVEHFETVIPSIESKLFFNKLKETLNELSDGITTNNTSTIDRLGKEINSVVEKLRIDPSYVTENGATADERFKKQLLQSHSATTNDLESESANYSQIPANNLDNKTALRPSSSSRSKEKQDKKSIIDQFAEFRFARKRHSSVSYDNDNKAIESDPISPIRKPITSLPSTRSLMKPRLMISYNHVSKPLCTDIYNYLTKDGYDVWIDFKEMHGSTLMAMAQAIEDSDIIIFCMTENYSKSFNCQKEAEYAFVRQKVMIPLLLQAKYKPTGWLGFLLGASFYIDFTKNDFTQNYEKLKNEIEANATRISNNKNDVIKLTSNSTMDKQETNVDERSTIALPPTEVKPKSTINRSRGCILL